MRTQLEINQYLQNTTIKNARHLLDIESCIRNNNLHLPNNVIIHENGISSAEFYKWFENSCFKDGDIIISYLGNIHLLMNSTTSYLYLDITHNALRILDGTLTSGVEVVRLATEEEKQKLFDAIKTNGYRWNFQAKRLEKLIIPKFKKGDKVRVKNGGSQPRTIEDVCDTFYTLVYIGKIDFTDQDNWELVPNKFDINTLKPFDKVLVRDCNYERWMTAVYSHKQDNYFIASGHFKQCIPYEGNEHLLGTSNDCSDFYKTWNNGKEISN